jgi:DNA-directed RNA polymerase alpha subunit
MSKLDLITFLAPLGVISVNTIMCNLEATGDGNLQRLLQFTRKDVLQWPNMGRVRLASLEALLSERGLQLAYDLSALPSSRSKILPSMSLISRMSAR